MKFVKLIAIGLLVAGVTACEGKEEKAAADGTNSATTAAETLTASQEAEAPDAASRPIEATGAVAVVNGQEISKDEFNKEVDRLVTMFAGQAPPQMLVQMKDAVVDQLVSKQLIETAIEKANIDVTPADVDAEFANFQNQLDMSSPGGAEEYLKRVGRTQAEMKEDIKKSLQLKKMLAKDHDIAVAAADVQKFYDENKERFDVPERVSAKHILLLTQPGASDADVAAVEKRSQEILEKAKAPGADFAALANELSEEPGPKRGGELGFFVRGQMVPEFETAVWDKKVDEIVGPVRTQFGFHVIKKTGESPAKSPTFAEVKPMIEAQMEEPKLKEAMGVVLEKLKADATIELKLENIKTNIPAGMPPMMPPGLGGHEGHAHPPIGGAHDGEAPKLELKTLE